MELIVIILLAFIAYFLWKIYKQREEDRTEARNKEYQKEREHEFLQKYQTKYPHLVGKMENSWLEVFNGQVERGIPLLKMAQALYIQGANNTKQDMQVDRMLDRLWDITEEMLEHLEKYHESTKYEFEIALTNYWQQIVTEADSFIGEPSEKIKKLFQTPVFTNIEDIVTWFPEKKTHPKSELSFLDSKTGEFPRESKGSEYIKRKLNG